MLGSLTREEARLSAVGAKRNASDQDPGQLSKVPLSPLDVECIHARTRNYDCKIIWESRSVVS